MPSWKKLVQSGSSASLNSLYVSSGVTGSLRGTAQTSSYVNTLNQYVLIGSASYLTVGTASLGSTENTLILGIPPNGIGGGEGGQIMLQAPLSGGFTSASMIDNYQNYTRLLRGSNNGSDAVVAQWNMHTKQMSLPAYNSLNAFSGTPVAALGVNSSGDIITIQTGSGAGGGGGSTFQAGTNVDNRVLTATGGSPELNGEANLTFNGSSLSVTGTVTASGAIVSLANNAMYFRGGDDAEFWDINVANTVGIYGQQTQTVAGLKLGSSGATLFGSASKFGIGTTTPSLGTLEVNGNVYATSFTGSLQGTATTATVASTVSVTNWTNGLWYPTFVVASTGNNSIVSSKPTYDASINLLTTTSSWANIANTSSVVATTLTSNNTNYPIIFVTSSNNSPGSVLNFNNDRLTFNPSTGLLTTAIVLASSYTNTTAGTINPITSSWASNAVSASFASTAISSSFARNSSTASVIVTAAVSNNTNYPIIFIPSSTDSPGSVLNFDANNKLYFNPNSSTLSVAKYANTDIGTINNITSSWASNVVSASYARSASFATSVLSSSFASTSTSASFATYARSSSFVSTIRTGSNAVFYPTFVDENNGTLTFEQLYTDGNNFLTFQPADGVLSAKAITSTFTGNLTGTASWASNALTASYTPNALVTASVSSNVLTFTKGNGTTFNLTVNTGSGGGGGGSTSPGGIDTQVQFNSASAFSGNNGFTYDYTNKTVTAEKLRVSQWVELKNPSTVDDNNTPYTATSAEAIFLCNTVNASVDIDLSACQVDGRIVIVKDIGGNAANNFITFSNNTIDNNAFTQLDNNYQGVTMVYFQSAGFWCIIGQSI